MAIINRPTTKPLWATTGDKTEPSGAKKATGWVDVELPPHEYFNWLLNLIYLWIDYLDFISKPITFSGSYDSGGTIVADISLENDSGAIIEVFAAGLNGSNFVLRKVTYSVRRKTGAITSNKQTEINDSDASEGDIEFIQDGNDLNIKIKSTTGTWVAAGTIEINASGIVTIN